MRSISKNTIYLILALVGAGPCLAQTRTWRVGDGAHPWNVSPVSGRTTWGGGWAVEILADDDGDGLVDEDPVEVVDNDGDALFNEDPPEERLDNDGDGSFDEDPPDGLDNDGDGLVDEDASEAVDNDQAHRDSAVKRFGNQF